MLNILAKLAPVITGMTKNEDGTDKPVTGEFNWLVRLPMLLGTILLLCGLFAPVPEDKKDEVYEIGLALLVGGPVTYGARRRVWTKGQAALAQKAPAQPVAAPPPAVEPVAAPKSDDDAAKQIENL